MHAPCVNQIIRLNIHNLGNSGEGVGSYDGYTVFVDGALPGEVVEVQFVECKKRYGRAQLLSILTPSSDRVEPPCPLFGRCGGCQLMHLSYPKQLEMKQRRVIEALQRIGKIHDAEVEPCLPSPSSLEYRNKIQLPVRQGKDGLMLGLYARASHDLVEVDYCFIHSRTGDEIYQAVSKIIQASGIAAYDPGTGEGELRHVLIKSTVYTNEAMIILVTNGEASKELLSCAKRMMAECKAVKGVVQNINQGRDNVILGRKYHLLEGLPYIQEKLCGLSFKVSPASFFQVNPQQAECLYAKVLELADLKGGETVLDAYCGVGTLSLLLARYAGQVIGVECVAEAIVDAKENAQLNEIGNAFFVCAHSEEYVQTLAEIDLILLNPPRQGCEPSFLRSVGRISPERIVYVSCDPATLARDLAQLYLYGYRIETAQPFDMFPQTAHVECVVKLTKR